MNNTFVKLNNVEICFPVFNAPSASLKNRAINTITRGRIQRDHDGVTVVQALKNVNLQFSKGEKVGLIGHNGSGKTTLLRLLSGIYSPTSGCAEISGRCLSLINIGLGIDPEATGRENILIRAVLMGIKPVDIRRIMDDLIEFTGLGEFIDLPFRTYSTGMQLRLAFAVATSIKSEILIMDEWLSTGDEDFKHKANERLRSFVDGADILVLASHSRELISENCNRVIWLEGGEVKMDGEPKDVLDSYF